MLHLYLHSQAQLAREALGCQLSAPASVSCPSSYTLRRFLGRDGIKYEYNSSSQLSSAWLIRWNGSTRSAPASRGIVIKRSGWLASRTGASGLREVDGLDL